MKSYAFDVVRSHIPSMDLDEAYADADTIAMHIQDTLHRQMADYGYEIVKALITNIEPDQRVKDAMNNINAARSATRIAADRPGRRRRRRSRSRRPRARRRRCACRARAWRRSARRSPRGCRSRWRSSPSSGLDPKEAMALVALTQYTDMIRSLGEDGKTNTILLPHSPAAVGSLMDQIQQGMLTGNLAADAAQQNVANGTRRAAQPRPPAAR